MLPVAVTLSANARVVSVATSASEPLNSNTRTSAAHAAFAANVTARLAARPVEADLRVAFVTAFSTIMRAITTDALAIFEESGGMSMQMPMPMQMPMQMPAAGDVAPPLRSRVSLLVARALLAAPGLIDGLGATLNLLAAAAHSPRAPVVCRPAPHWLTVASGGARGGARGGGSGDSDGADTLYSPAEDVALLALDDALKHIPFTSAIAAHAFSGQASTLAEWLSAWPLPSLALVYWLLCLAPMRLEASIAPTLPGAVATFNVRRGAHDGHAPLWDARAAARHGTLPPLLHGTATENAYCMLGLGPRVLSNSRHESSGALFGAGVYLSSDPGVALNFAERRGVGWAGWTLSGFALSRGGATDLTLTSPPLNQLHLLPSPHIVPSTEGGARTRVVLEVTAIAAPSNTFVEGGKARPAGAQALSPPKGAYVVIPLAEHLVITRVHFFDADAEGGAPLADGAVAAAQEGQRPSIVVLFFLIFSAAVSVYSLYTFIDTIMTIGEESQSPGDL